MKISYAPENSARDVWKEKHRLLFVSWKNCPKSIYEQIHADICDRNSMSLHILNILLHLRMILAIIGFTFSRGKTRSLHAWNFFLSFLNECDALGHRVKIFRSGNEFDCVKEILEKRGIKFEMSVLIFLSKMEWLNRATTCR